jgi:hypothetical protein
MCSGAPRPAADLAQAHVPGAFAECATAFTCHWVAICLQRELWVAICLQ